MDKKNSLTVMTILLAVMTVLTAAYNVAAADKIIKMGYRTNERAPLIAKEPDNSGLYKEIYTTAAEKIGYKLNIVRLPKKRILIKLVKGEIDFYPGFNYSKARAEYTYYVENGLPGGDVGLSRADMPNITDLSQLKGKTLLTNRGSPDFLLGVDGVKEMCTSEMDIARAIKILQLKRADFFIYNKSSIEYYLKKNNIEGMKVHPQAYGGVKPLYLGFSKSSPLFKGMDNPNYNPDESASPLNQPLIAKPGCVAALFAIALKEMKESGETYKIYAKYYGQGD